MSTENTISSVCNQEIGRGKKEKHTAAPGGGGACSSNKDEYRTHANVVTKNETNCPVTINSRRKKGPNCGWHASVELIQRLLCAFMKNLSPHKKCYFQENIHMSFSTLYSRGSDARLIRKQVCFTNREH